MITALFKNSLFLYLRPKLRFGKRIWEIPT
jgi:hypothetical protein